MYKLQTYESLSILWDMSIFTFIMLNSYFSKVKCYRFGDSWMPNIQDSVQFLKKRSMDRNLCCMYRIWVHAKSIQHITHLQLHNNSFQIASPITYIYTIPLSFSNIFQRGVTWWVMKLRTSKITGRSANVFKLTPGSSVTFCWKPTRTAGHIHCPASMRKITGFFSKPRAEQKTFLNHSHWSSLKSGCYIISPLRNEWKDGDCLFGLNIKITSNPNTTTLHELYGKATDLTWIQYKFQQSISLLPTKTSIFEVKQGKTLSPCKSSIFWPSEVKNAHGGCRSSRGRIFNKDSTPHRAQMAKGIIVHCCWFGEYTYMN